MPTDDVTVLTVVMPGASLEPIVFRENGAALRMVLVPRPMINALTADWEVPGVYFLLFPKAVAPQTKSHARPGVYVGKTGPGGLRSRMQTHTHLRVGWTHALLIARDTSSGFNSAHVGWLEGRVWAVAKVAAAVDLLNGNRPRDETLEDYERAWLEGTIEPIRQVMRLLGYPLDPPDDEPTTDPGARRYHGITMKRLIETGILSAGEVLEYTGRGHEGTKGTLEADGALRVDGVRYASPSAAGAAIRGGAVNGWEYWARRDASDNLVSLGELRGRVKLADPRHTS